MYIREITLLYICVFVHFRGIESALVIKPQNLAVVSGESVTLHCASDVSAGNIVWSTTDPGSFRIDGIYNLNVLASSFSSYISVSDREDGNCSLNIKASFTAAKIYTCTEADTGEEESAELIVMKSGLQCDSTNFNGSVRVRCFTVSAGNWIPVVGCKQWNADFGLTVLSGNQTITVDNNVITRTWNYTSKNEWFHIFCETTFKESEKPKRSSATNIPVYFNQVLAYNGTCVSHGETISNNSSTECPECPAVATACPVAAAAKCPECPTRVTACPVAISAKCPEYPTGVTKCPECPAGVTVCPVATSAKCPEYPTGVTKCPECPAGVTACPVATSAKCPECSTGVIECPECLAGVTACPVATSAKCLECPAGATACPVTAATTCPECPRGATKCPECPAGATECPVTAAAKCPECPTRPTKCPECPTVSTARSVAATTEYPTASNVTDARACFVEAVAPCLVAATSNCSVTAAASSAARTADCLVEAGTPCLLAAAFRCTVILAALCSVGSAECCLGAGCLTSVVLNCVFVLAETGLGDAFWKWHSKEDTEDKKPKSTEQGSELKNPDQDISKDPSVLSLDHQQD